MIASRRTFLAGAGAAGMAAMLGGCATMPSGAPFFSRIGKPVGLQLYALVGQDPVADPEALFAQVRAMGYGEMELPTLLGHTPAALRQAAANAGIPVASLHVPAVALSPGSGDFVFGDNPDAVADVAAALGTRNVVIPFPILPAGFAFGPGEDFPTAITRGFRSAGRAHWQAMAERFNVLGDAMQERGVVLGYHNHNLEFAPLDGTTPWDILMAETDPSVVKLQLDIGWVAQAGRDPVAELAALSGRVVSLHVKDVAAGTPSTFYFGGSTTPIGEGRVDWARVLPAAQAAGAQHYFVEQEPPYAIPRAEAMQRSFDYLNDLVA